MSRHSFEPKVAEKVGVNAAVVYQNIVFWAEHKMNNRNRKQDREYWHDGYWWTYNSRSAFAEQFSYLTADQIRTALDKLVACGLLQKGNYNKAGFDKTNWYAPTISSEWPVGEKSPMERGSDPNPLGKKPQPIPDSKPDNKPDSKNARERADDLFSAENGTDRQAERPDQEFDRFWAVYPKKAGKPAAKKAWAKAIKREKPEVIIAAAKRYSAWLSSAQPGEFRPHVKYAQGWLNDGRWDEFAGSEAPDHRWDDLRPAQQRSLADGRCPPSMLESGQPNEVAAFWLEKHRRARA
jgi:hypothetical protein